MNYEEHAFEQRLAARDLLEFTGDLHPEPRQILEPGCGTGLYTRMLRSRFPHADIQAVDLDETLLHEARLNCRDRLCISQSQIQSKTGEKYITCPCNSVHFSHANAETLCSGCFDLITSNAVMHWFTNLPGALSHYAAILAGSGLLTCSLFGPETYHELNMALREALGKDTRVIAARFLNRRELEAALRWSFPRVEVRETCYSSTFPTLRDLFLHVRYTRERGNVINTATQWTPGKMARVEQSYLARYGEIRATYQVFLCKAGL